jgi:ABC-2 type transport system permease protein
MFAAVERRADGPTASARRIGAMILRYWYLLRSSWPRLLELIYWPAVQMLMWGFLQSYLHQRTGILAAAAGALLGAVLLWDVLFRGQIGFSISFLEEMWARNLGHLMISPLRTGEFVLALMVMSIIRVIIGLGPVTLMALIFFGFNVFSLGVALAGFFLVLIATSWSIGLVVCGLVLRQGLGAESLAWSLIFLLLPLTCVYYPVSTLPEWLQYISLSLPPTYVFEGMRAILIDGVFRGDLLLRGLMLNVVYLAVGLTCFYALMRSARVQGSLLVSGE